MQLGGIKLKSKKNCFLFLAISGILVFLIWMCSMKQGYEPEVVFHVGSASGVEEITLYDAGEGKHILFLPSYAELEEVCLASRLKEGVVIGGVAMHEGAGCGGFELAQEYPLTINGKNSGTLQFLRSANVATMYIDTATGSVERIHGNKEYEEQATVAVYGMDGICSSVDAGCTLKGRGNSTWTYEKKPYLLTLSGEAGILGMAPATKWVLLANATDETNLRNKLIFDLARQVGMEWVPDCAYVDVYLNGEYSGLYLLTEKVEVGPNRLDLVTDAGEFLCKIDLEARWSSLRNPFLTQAGRTVEVTSPRIQSEAQRNDMTALVDQMERIILSGEPISSAQNIDWDSWVRRYLIDEISGNIDSDLISSYFYYSDGVFCAGPVWDYDMALGNSIRNRNPNSYIAKNFCKASGYESPYYSALTSNDSFRERVIAVYASEFIPVLMDMMESGIQDLSTYLSTASTLNSIRWSKMFAKLYVSTIIPSTPESIIDYLNMRIDFLNSAWLDGVEYCTVQLKHIRGEAYENASVRKGTCFQSDMVDTNDVVWLVEATGEVFDFSQPVMEDVILVRSGAEGAVSDVLVTRDYITIASIAGLVSLLLCFGAVELMRQKKERKNADGRTHVSP